MRLRVWTRFCLYDASVRTQVNPGIALLLKALTFDTLGQTTRVNDDLVLTLAIAAWRAEENPGLGLSFSAGVPEADGWAGI